MIRSSRLSILVTFIALLVSFFIFFLFRTDDINQSKSAIDIPPSSPLTNNCTSLSDDTKIRLGKVRTGNSLLGYRDLTECYAESDFYLSNLGFLVSSHDLYMSESCGSVKELSEDELLNCRLVDGSSPARLTDFLSLSVRELYIDLKDTQVITPDSAPAVRSAINEVKDSAASNKAILMIYQTNDEIKNLISTSGVRTALKGYPTNKADVLDLVNSAKENNYGFVCVNISHINEEVLNYAKSLDIKFIGWEWSSEVTIDQLRILNSMGLERFITNRSAELKSHF